MFAWRVFDPPMHVQPKTTVHAYGCMHGIKPRAPASVTEAGAPEFAVFSLNCRYIYSGCFIYDRGIVIIIPGLYCHAPMTRERPPPLLRLAIAAAAVAALLGVLVVVDGVVSIDVVDGLDVKIDAVGVESSPDCWP